jgi:hypothetical protein
MELVPYALNKIGLRGQFQMVFACDNYRPCRKLIRQCHRNGTKPKLAIACTIDTGSRAVTQKTSEIALGEVGKPRVRPRVAQVSLFARH